MPRTIPPLTRHPTTTSPVPTPATPLSLEARLAATGAAMSLALDEAAVAFEVNTAHIATEVVDLADVVTLPLTPTLQPPAPYATPVAALLQRAHHRLTTDGWCSGALVDANGARCLYGAIHTEARGDRGLESRGLDVLLDAIRRKFGDVDSVPGFNDAWNNGGTPICMLGEAASLADARGL